MFRHPAVFVFVIIAVLYSSEAGGERWKSLPTQLLDCLRLQGITPITDSDPEFHRLRFSHNRRIDVYPKAIIFPNSTLSVAKAIQCTRASGTFSFSVRSGKHSYEGYGVQKDALLIDISGMKSMTKIDEGANEVWLESGLTLGEVYYYLSAWNKTLPGGTCGSVGMGGHVLGAGFGVRSRAYGLMIDHVAAIEIVNVDGEILIADSSHYSDLFWALLGAGQGQFGIVTRFRFQTVQAQPVIEFSYAYPVESAAKALSFLQGFATNSKAPNEMWMSVSLVRSRNSVAFYGQYIGSRNDYDKAISNVGLAKAMGEPRSSSINRLSYIQSILSLANIPASEPPRSLLTYDFGFVVENWKARSGFVKELISDNQLDDFVASFYNESAPEFNIWDAYILIDSWGGKIRDPSYAKRSVFAHRSAILSVQSWVSWKTGDPIEKDMRDWQNGVWTLLKPSLSGAFVNYADGDLVDYMEAYYPGQVEKLIDIKTKYDPENIMHYAQSIPVDNSIIVDHDETFENGVRISRPEIALLSIIVAYLLF